MKMVKVSVIVPAYNEEKRIERCLKSLLNQTYNDYEIIVVNDGSTDDTMKVLSKYKNKITIIDKENGCQGSARNLGIKKAKGKYLTFVDSDDYIAPNMLEELAETAEKKMSDIVACDIFKVIDDKNIYYNNLTNFTNDNVINFMLSHPGPVARLYKKSLFINNNLFFIENAIYEDLGVIPLLGIYVKNVSYVNKPLYYYVIRSGSSMIQEKYSAKLEDIFIICEHLKNEFIKRSGNRYLEVLEYLYIEHLLYSAVLRFAKFHKKDMINKCVDILKTTFPHYKKNRYLKVKSVKFKLVCFFASHKCYKILFKLSNMR